MQAHNRYAIGDRSDFLNRAKDGSFTIYLQSKSPGGERESNWLPTPADGKFYLVLRTYGPKQDLLDRKWAPPAVRLAE